MSSLSTLTCELIFYLTDGPQSSKWKPLFQQHLFSRTITQNLLSGSIFLGNPDTLVTEWVKLGFVFFFPPARGVVQRWFSPLLYFISGSSSLLWLSFIFPFSLYPWSVGWILVPFGLGSLLPAIPSKSKLWCILPRLQVCVPDVSAERVEAALHLHIWPTT